MGARLSSGCCCSTACCTSHAYQVDEPAREILEDVRVVSIGNTTATERDSKIVLRVLAQLWQIKLTKEEQDHLLWRPLQLSPVHLKLAHVKDNVDGSCQYILKEESEHPFTTYLTTPGTDLRRTGEKFVQWTDTNDEGSICAYGLSFSSVQDTLQFMSAFSVLAQHQASNLFTTVPPPTSSISHLQIMPTHMYTSTPLHPNHHLNTSQQSKEPTPVAIDWTLSALHNSCSIHSQGELTLSYQHNSCESHSAAKNQGNCQLLSVRKKDNENICSAHWHTEVEQRTGEQAYVPAYSQVEGLSKIGVEQFIENNHSVSSSSSCSSIGLVRGQRKVYSLVSEEFEGTEDDDSMEDEEGIITSIDDVEYSELFHPTEPLQVNKVLDDIIEEEDEKEQEDEEWENHLEEEVLAKYRRGAVDQRIVTSGTRNPDLQVTLKSFDQLLEDLRASQILEVTVPQRESYRLSRQSSMIESPVLPSTLPPGPTLGPNINTLFEDCNENRTSFEITPEVRSALVRLSMVSVDCDPPPLLPTSPPPGQRLLPDPSTFSEIHHHNPTPTQLVEEGEVEENADLEGRQRASCIDLPPPLEKGDSLDESDISSRKLRLTPSFLHTIMPPEAFGDLEVPVTSNEEEETKRFPRELRDGDKDSEITSSSRQLFNQTRIQMEDKEEQNRIGVNAGSNRKTGWLEVKAVLVGKNKKVAMKSKRRWKKYWVVMKDVTLLLYQCDQPSDLDENAHVDLRLDISRCLVTPILDHMTRDHMFCISTSSGNTYYMQTASQGEVLDWITVIHSAAGVAMASKPRKQQAACVLERLLLETSLKIDKEEQLRKMFELQLMKVVDYTSKSTISKQLVILEENIEYLHMEKYRLKCYLAALQGSEQPNSQSLLATVSKPTKTLLGKVGMFSVSSLHAVVSCRFTNRFPRDAHSLSKSSTSTSLLSPGKWKLWKRNTHSIEPSKSSRQVQGLSFAYKPYPSLEEQGMEEEEKEPTLKKVVENELALRSGFGVVLTVELPNNRSCSIPLRSDMTVHDVLQICCKRVGLDSADYFIRLKTETVEGHFLCKIPQKDDLLSNLHYSSVELSQKCIRTICISQTSFPDRASSIGVRLQPIKSDLGFLSKLLVVGVTEGSLADHHGINELDEILLINDTAVTQMTLEEVKSAFKEHSISITISSCQIDSPFPIPVGGNISDLICPAPPSHGQWISRETLGGLIIPKPSLEEEDLTGNDSGQNLAFEKDMPEFTRGLVNDLMKGSLEVTGIVDRWKAYEVSPENFDDNTTMSHEKRLLKVLQELMNTEEEHVKTLELTLERYLDPLQVEKFIPHEKMSVILADFSHITDQQRQFLKKLNNVLNTYEEGEDFNSVQVIVLGMATVFMSHMEAFRQYSHFCATQHRLKQLLDAVQPCDQLQLFMDARNPKGDPGLKLGALLTKPIVRLMRYSLFLQAMRELSENRTDVRKTLTDVITAMNQVAQHINEVQKVTELYAHLFDYLLLQSQLAEFGVSVEVSQLQHHGMGMWLSHGQISKGWKKGQGPEIHIFVFVTAVVLLNIDREDQHKRVNHVSKQTTDDVKHSALLPLAWCKVQDLPNSDGVTNMWQILYRQRGQLVAYLIRSSSHEDKNIIVPLLRRAIQEQVSIYGNLSVPVSPCQSAAPSLYTGQSSPSCDSNVPSSPQTVSPLTIQSDDCAVEQTLL